MSLQKLRRHVFKRPTVDVFHSYSRNGAKNSEIYNFYFDAVGLELAFFVILWGLSQHHILKLKVSVYNLAVMAIIDGIQKLNEN